jgi:hypothetical protein
VGYSREREEGAGGGCIIEIRRWGLAPPCAPQSAYLTGSAAREVGSRFGRSVWYFQERAINFMHNRCRFFLSGSQLYKQSLRVFFPERQFCNVKAGTAKYELSTPQIFRWKWLHAETTDQGLK